MEFNQHINTAIISCVIFLALLSKFKKNKTGYGYGFLSLLFLSLSFIFVDDVLTDTNIYLDHPILMVIFEPFLFSCAPFIYLAVVHLTSIRKQVKAKTLLHFIPYVFVLSLYIFAYFHNSANKQSSEDVASDETLNNLLILLFFIQMGVYIYLSLRELKRHKKILPNFVASIGENDFHWLNNVIIMLALLSTVTLFEVILEHIHVPFYYSFIYLIGFYFIGVQVAVQKDVLVVFHDIEQQKKFIDHNNIGEHSATSASINAEAEILDYDPIENSPPIQDDELSARKQIMSEEKLMQYKDLLLKLMETEKPYLDSEINLAKLGKMLLLNTYQTSYLINTCFNENFYAFINRYRLDDCKIMLACDTYNHLSILDIAFEAGFNSKTTFNTSFKKYTGMSPKEFRIKSRN